MSRSRRFIGTLLAGLLAGLAASWAWATGGAAAVEAFDVAGAGNGGLWRYDGTTLEKAVDYGAVADLLEAKGQVKRRDIPTAFHSNWLDNSKARMVLGWRPEVGLDDMIERAWSYARAADDPRIIWYPG